VKGDVYMADASPANHNLIENLLNFEYIYFHWLHYFDDNAVSYNLSLPLQILVQSMFVEAELSQIQVDANSLKRVWEYYDQVRRQVSRSNNPLDVGYVEAACACVDFRLGRMKDAIDRLQDAYVRYLPEIHYPLIVQWLRGIVLWNSPNLSDQWEALAIWDECYRKFDKLARDANTAPGRNRWYADRRDEIKQLFATIKRQIQGNRNLLGPRLIWSEVTQPGVQPQPGIQQPPASSRFVAPPTSGATPEKQKPVSASVPQKPGSLTWIHGYPLLDGVVSAGEFEDIRQGDPGIIDYVLINEVTIDGLPYQVISLRDSKVVPYIYSRDAYVIKVAGNSMDAYPILPGDYVMIDPLLLPVPGNVVITKIIESQGDNPLSNLKYLESIQSGEIVLSYRSKSPTYHDEQGNNRKIVVTAEEDRSVEILGVAIARFTPRIDDLDSDSKEY